MEEEGAYSEVGVGGGVCLRCLETMTLLKRTFVNPFTLFKATNHVNIVASCPQ